MKSKMSRWDRFGTSIFSVMSQQAVQHGAVNLAQGFPDFDGPEEIKKAATAAMQEGKNQYAPANGISPLRQLLSERQERVSGLKFCPERETTVLTGATEAIFCAMVGLLEPGDEIISFEPFYDSYPAAALAAGAIFKSVRLHPPEWSFVESELEAAITPRTRALIINTPHNPTGKVFNRRELEIICKLACKHDLLVFTDEVYEEIVFTPHQHLYLAAMPGMRERVVTISSTSKTFSMTGWKIGYTFAAPELTNRIRAVHQFTVFCSATPLQWGMLAALKLQQDYFAEFKRDYLKRRDYLVSGLNEVGLKVNTPAGTYFALADYAAISEKNDLEFAQWLVSEIKVAAIPLSPFYIDQNAAAKRSRYLRFAFCKNETTMQQGIERLRVLCR